MCNRYLTRNFIQQILSLIYHKYHTKNVIYKKYCFRKLLSFANDQQTVTKLLLKAIHVIIHHNYPNKQPSCAYQHTTKFQSYICITELFSSKLKKSLFIQWHKLVRKRPSAPKIFFQTKWLNPINLKYYVNSVWILRLNLFRSYFLNFRIIPFTFTRFKL